SVDTHFVADKTTAELIELKVLKNDSVVSGKDDGNSNVVSAKVVDKYKNPVKGTELQFKLSNNAISDAATTLTNDMGDAGFRFHNTRAGITTVSVKLGDREHSVDTNFKADTATARIELKANKTTVVANGKDGVKVTATARDVHSNLLNDFELGLAVTTGTVMSNTRTGADGSATIDWISGTAAAKGVLTVTWDLIKTAKIDVEFSSIWTGNRSNPLIFSAAKKYCEQRGEQLPSIEELKLLFTSNFVLGVYLSRDHYMSEGGWPVHNYLEFRILNGLPGYYLHNVVSDISGTRFISQCVKR
ncbi:Ig-like domain-containing protein, partial [Pseudomonas sp. D47]|uniref:Ig-like domain-containing protein n=1 Tax=Pseudomonas sp. D47 TaxID=3159447 RepID=UPI00387B15D2